MNDLVKNLLVTLAVGLVLLTVFKSFTPAFQAPTSEVNYSAFLDDVRRDQVRKVRFGEGSNGVVTVLEFEKADGTKGIAYGPRDPELINDLVNHKVEVIQDKPDTSPSMLVIILNLLPYVLLIGIFIYFIRMMQQGGSRGAMTFGRSRAKLQGEDQVKVTFADVAGCDEAKEEVAELVEFLRDPGKFQKLGGRIPRGVLMVGSPGTGKTLLARAIAGEAKVPFFSISGSDFVEMFVGVGASRVRDMFEQAKKNAPCIIFIDEIDAVGRHRGAGLGGGNDEREQTLNQLLVEMDGFEANEGVILIAATNRPDVLDPALLRPGRFDRQIVVPNPDINGREQILKVHMRKVPLAPDVDARTIARGTPGFSGADLANLVNEAALMAARAGKRVVTMYDFEQSKDKVMMGAERRSMVMTEEEKTMTAYHEGGHAIVNIHMPGNDPLHKVTIIPRGRALGVTWALPEKDRLSITKQFLEAKIAMCFGGRIAEQLIYGENHLNSGASNDIKQATAMARAMVTEYGMSEKLGPLRYNDNEEEVFLGHSVAQRKNVSDATAAAIDSEVRRIVEEGEATARRILSEHLDELHALAKGLLEYETLNADEVRDLLAGKPIRQGGDSSGPHKPRSSIPTSGTAPKPTGGFEPKPAGR